MSNRLTRWEIEAALSAIAAMLAGEDNEGDWPADVTREELEGAYEKLRRQLKQKHPRRAMSAANAAQPPEEASKELK